MEGKVTSIFADGDEYYALVEQDGRSCYLNVYGEELIDKDIYDKKTLQVAEKILRDKGELDISHIPHIEGASEAIQKLYIEMHMADGTMVFVEEDEPAWWETEQEKMDFMAQVDADIYKYKLQNVIRKYEDDCLYAVYGDFMSAFTSTKDFFR